MWPEDLQCSSSMENARRLHLIMAEQTAWRSIHHRETLLGRQPGRGLFPFQTDHQCWEPRAYQHRSVQHAAWRSNSHVQQRPRRSRRHRIKCLRGKYLLAQGLKETQAVHEDPTLGTCDSNGKGSERRVCTQPRSTTGRSIAFGDLLFSGSGSPSNQPTSLACF